MTDVDPLHIPTNDDAAVDPVDFLWNPYLSFGSLAVLDGDPGVSKGA